MPSPFSKLAVVAKAAVRLRRPRPKLPRIETRKLMTATTPGLAMDVVMFSLTTLRESADACPPLKSAVSGLVQFIDYAGKMSDNKAEIHALHKRMDEIQESLIRALPDNIELLSNVQLSATEVFNKAVQDICTDMESLTKRGRVLRFLRAKKDAEQLANFARQLDAADGAFTRSLIIATKIKTRVILQQTANHGAAIGQVEQRVEAIQHGQNRLIAVGALFLKLATESVRRRILISARSAC